MSFFCSFSVFDWCVLIATKVCVRFVVAVLELNGTSDKNIHKKMPLIVSIDDHSTIVVICTVALCIHLTLCCYVLPLCASFIEIEKEKMARERVREKKDTFSLFRFVCFMSPWRV